MILQMNLLPEKHKYLLSRPPLNYRFNDGRFYLLYNYCSS